MIASHTVWEYTPPPQHALETLGADDMWHAIMQITKVNMTNFPAYERQFLSHFSKLTQALSLHNTSSVFPHISWQNDNSITSQVWEWKKGENNKQRKALRATDMAVGFKWKQVWRIWKFNIKAFPLCAPTSGLSLLVLTLKRNTIRRHEIQTDAETLMKMWSFKFVQHACKCCILTTESVSIMSNSCCTLSVRTSMVSSLFHIHQNVLQNTFQVVHHQPGSRLELWVGKILEVITNLFTTNSAKPFEHRMLRVFSLSERTTETDRWMWSCSRLWWWRYVLTLNYDTSFGWWPKESDQSSREFLRLWWRGSGRLLLGDVFWARPTRRRPRGRARTQLSCSGTSHYPHFLEELEAARHHQFVVPCLLVAVHF